MIYGSIKKVKIMSMCTSIYVCTYLFVYNYIVKDYILAA